jgi:hypothetical protein
MLNRTPEKDSAAGRRATRPNISAIASSSVGLPERSGDLTPPDALAAIGRRLLLMSLPLRESTTLWRASEIDFV